MMQKESFLPKMARLISVSPLASIQLRTSPDKFAVHFGLVVPALLWTRGRPRQVSLLRCFGCLTLLQAIAWSFGSAIFALMLLVTGAVFMTLGGFLENVKIFRIPVKFVKKFRKESERIGRYGQYGVRKNR